MGAWGEGPFDNDGAQDWLSALKSRSVLEGEIRKALRTPLRKAVAESHIRVACALIIQAAPTDLLSEEQTQRLAAQAVGRLEELLADEQWISTWKSETAIKRNLRGQIKKLKRISEE